MSDDLVYLSATEALTQFRAGTLSPVELLRSLAERAVRLGPTINPFVEEYWDEALVAAREAEARYRNGTARPLEGIPLSVKDSLAIRGRSFMCGSLVFRDRVAEETDPCVERLLDAGAILTGQTACPELAWSWVCHSRLSGVTRNPWNLAVSPGGSSGGSAAALAAGLSTLSLGSDSAGSIRMPAAMCGVVGYKPPAGRNPEGAQDCDDLYNEIGPLTRTVADCVLMQNVLAGPHPADHTTLRPKLVLPWPMERVAGLRVAYSLDFGFMEITPAVRANTLALLQRLRALGVTVTEVATDWAQAAMTAADHYGDFLYAEDMGPLLRDHAELLTEEIRQAALYCAQVTRTQFIHSFHAMNDAWRSFGPILEQHDAFICPTVATTELPAELMPGDSFLINGKAAERWIFTIPFNMFRCCPALAIPSGRGPNNVPTGVQVVGRTFDDVTVFRLAAALEQQECWYQDRAQRPASLESLAVSGSNS